MSIELIKKLAGACCVFALLVALFNQQLLYFLEPTFVTPDEDDALTLYVHHRRLWSADEVIIVRAKHLDGHLQWCTKAPDGSWNPAFTFGK